MVRILIADDHDLIRRGLRDIIAAQTDWTVCGEARNGTEAVTRSKELTPDIAILDLKMPNLNGLEAAREIQRECPKVEILMISSDYSEELIRTLVKTGIRAFIKKSDSERDLVSAIRALHAHKPYFTPLVKEEIIDVQVKLGTRRNTNLLTPREREVLLLIAEGKSNRQISLALDIAEKTTETHRTNLMRKLNARKTSDLVRYALRNNFAEP